MRINYTKLYRMELPHRAVSVYIFLADRANKDKECWPAIPTIAKELKLSESTTRRALKDLRKAGLIETYQRYRENGGKYSLEYKLIFGIFALGLAAMMVVYCLMMLLLSKLNPMPFCRKYAPTMIQVFSMASSNAALPLNIDACKKLGVSPKVYSLSLPLGATINMDGTCIYLSVVTLSLARIYGVEIPAATMLSVVISIIVLSVGAPGVPGSGMICLSVILTQLGVSVEAVGLVMGIDPLIGMMRCMSNCLSDVAVSCMVAKQEKVLDMDIYKQEHDV